MTIGLFYLSAGFKTILLWQDFLGNHNVRHLHVIFLVVLLKSGLSCGSLITISRRIKKTPDPMTFTRLGELIGLALSTRNYRCMLCLFLIPSTQLFVGKLSTFLLLIRRNFWCYAIEKEIGNGSSCPRDRQKKKGGRQKNNLSSSAAWPDTKFCSDLFWTSASFTLFYKSLLGYAKPGIT